MNMSTSPQVGRAVALAPNLHRILAPNPSAMTYHGTNTYILGGKRLAVIDPGPDNADHLRSILDFVAPHQRITKIIVTHAHRDHSGLARSLAEIVDAPVIAFGNAQSGRSIAMQKLSKTARLGGGEGLDDRFRPDTEVRDGDQIDVEDAKLTVIHTPGHLGNHICLQWNECCFTGDHVMGWASTLVSPPDGDLTDFMLSCRRLQRMPWRTFYPGHGDIVGAPAARLKTLIEHRLSRERSILDHLGQGPATATQLTHRIYLDTPPALLPAARRNVLAHLIDLHGRSLVAVEENIHPDAVFRLVAGGSA